MAAESTSFVDELIDAIVADPRRLPLATIASLSKEGHAVSVRRSHDRVVAVVSNLPGAGFTDLTPREREVATLIASGSSNKEVAVALGIRIGTAKDHVHSILTKTGAESRAKFSAAWFLGRSEGS